VVEGRGLDGQFPSGVFLTCDTTAELGTTTIAAPSGSTPG
jgi:hypothetical protein